ncbi:variable large family protein, partial [Borreliella bissettiae]|uniref:variable large family protein n=1 Tax=Borrelia bissettiae TaxID=64897 RepID=UPI001E3265AE
MKKISSAILLATLLIFINCKGSVDKAAEGKDSASIFYQSIINLGSGFIDVFNAFSGLVADVFSKADPKKSDVKTYFEAVSKTLTETKTKLDLLSKEKAEGSTDTKTSGKGDSG